ncbi:3'-5' exonuclease [Endozoicomonas sp. 2B-B]
MTPRTTKHLMVDIEAAGKSSSAALVSIGAVFFDPWTGNIGASFYQPIKLSSSQYFGGEIDASTVEWWMKQSDAARAVFNDEQRESLKHALINFKGFIEQHSEQGEVHVWGNGPSYDNAILSTAFNKTWIKQPWSFSKDTCVRTMVMLGRELGIDPKYDMKRDGEHHNALDDAIFQAQYVSVIWQRLFSGHQPLTAA